MKAKMGLLFFLLLSTLGCVGLWDYYVSNTVNSEGKYESWSNGVVRIRLENIRIYVNPYNYLFCRDGVAFWPYIPWLGPKKQRIPGTRT